MSRIANSIILYLFVTFSRHTCNIYFILRFMADFHDYYHFNFPIIVRYGMCPVPANLSMLYACQYNTNVDSFKHALHTLSSNKGNTHVW